MAFISVLFFRLKSGCCVGIRKFHPLVNKIDESRAVREREAGSTSSGKRKCARNFGLVIRIFPIPVYTVPPKGF